MDESFRRREQARELLRDRRVERRLKDVLAQVDLEPWELGEDWDDMVSDAIERARERGMKTQLVRVAELPVEWHDDMPTRSELTVLGPLAA